MSFIKHDSRNCLQIFNELNDYILSIKEKAIGLTLQS